MTFPLKTINILYVNRRNTDMTEKDFKAMKEIEVIKLIKNTETPRAVFNKACEYLIKKYEKTIHKAWWTLSRQMGGNPLVESKKDEFYSRAYEVVYTTILKVDLSKIYNDDFKLIQLVSLYLSNLRHTMINELIKESKNRPIEITYVDKDGEEASYTNSVVEYAYYEKEGYKDNPEYIFEAEDNLQKQTEAINECLSKWSSEEKAVYRGLLNKKTKKELSLKMNISASEINTITKKVKSDLKATLLAKGYMPSKA